MKRLSQLDNSQELIISVNNKLHYTTKEDLLSGNSYSMGEIENIYTGVPEIAEFDLKDVLYYIGEDIDDEDWNENVYADLMNYPETNAFLNVVKKVLEMNKVYVADDVVTIDVNF